MKNSALLRAVLVLAVLLILGLSAFADDPNTYYVEDITFQSPVKLSPPLKTGLDAWLTFYPDYAEPGHEFFEIIMVFMDKDMIDSLELDEPELMKYVKATYLGTAKSAREKSKLEFLGKTIEGDVQESNIPREHTLRVYLIPRKSGGKLAVCFRKYKEMNNDEAENIIKTFAQTLKISK